MVRPNHTSKFKLELIRPYASLQTAEAVMINEEHLQRLEMPTH